MEATRESGTRRKNQGITKKESIQNKNKKKTKTKKNKKSNNQKTNHKQPAVVTSEIPKKVPNNQ